MHIFNIFMLQQTVKNSVSLWEPGFTCAPCQRLWKGCLAFKRFGAVSLLSEGEDNAPFCRATLWPTIKLPLQEGSQAQALALAIRVWPLPDSFIFLSFDHTLAYLKNEGEIRDYFWPYVWLDRKNLSQEERETGSCEGQLTIDYGFCDWLKCVCVGEAQVRRDYCS